MKKYLFIWFGLFVVPIVIVGQQEDQYSMFALNKYAINSSYAGLDFSLSASVIYRKQWESLPGSINNIHVNVHMPYYKLNGGIGLMAEKKSSGALTKRVIMGSYNYIFDTQYGLLSFGTRLGAYQLSVDGSSIITPEGTYEGGINHNDPLLPSIITNGIGPAWDISSYFFNKKIEIGLQLSSIPQSKVNIESISFDLTSQANLFFQYKYMLFEKSEVLQSILLKTDFNQIQSDITTLVKINGNVFGGINLRGYNSKSLDAITLIVGMQLDNNFTLSYSYDIGISGLRSTNEGTHEILLNYNLRKFLGSSKRHKIIYNPRYL
ncbi:MAG: PorP/SprF family type IX secretion system membrane protein [Saprospiraceae bacterium]